MTSNEIFIEIKKQKEIKPENSFHQMLIEREINELYRMLGQLIFLNMEKGM